MEVFPHSCKFNHKRDNIQVDVSISCINAALSYLSWRYLMRRAMLHTEMINNGLTVNIQQQKMNDQSVTFSKGFQLCSVCRDM